LAWIGSSSTLQALEGIRPMLNHVGRAVRGTRLRLICDRFLRLDDLAVEDCPWDPATEAIALAGADIGIAWTPDDEWSRGKCGLKLLQYMAAGLPVVANPVGVQASLVEDGINGLHAQTDAEWVAAIGRLAADPALRRRMGAAGRARVEREFSIAAGGRLWRNLLDGLIRTRRVAG